MHFTDIDTAKVFADCYALRHGLTYCVIRDAQVWERYWVLPLHEKPGNTKHLYLSA